MEPIWSIPKLARGPQFADHWVAGRIQRILRASRNFKRIWICFRGLKRFQGRLKEFKGHFRGIQGRTYNILNISKTPPLSSCFKPLECSQNIIKTSWNVSENPLNPTETSLKLSPETPLKHQWNSIKRVETFRDDPCERLETFYCSAERPDILWDPWNLTTNPINIPKTPLSSLKCLGTLLTAPETLWDPIKLPFLGIYLKSSSNFQKPL